MKHTFVALLMLFCISAYSQDVKHSSLLIPHELIENANSIVRDQKIEIEIESRRKMTIKKSKIVTVLNNKGLNNIDAVEYYDGSTKVKSIEAIIYNSFGSELKKIKRKDFKDQSVADGFSVYSDNRMIYLDYTPTEYPFTIIYDSEVETSNTAFIPAWFPIDDFYESVEKSSIIIKFPSDLGFKYKEKNFIEDKIIKQENSNEISYQAVKLIARKFEEFSPTFKKMNPSVLFGLDSFYLEGVEGNATSWNEFGKWVYENLLKETEQVPEATIKKIKLLIGVENDPVKKARIVYNYVQKNSRYVSIQLGIGGWKPMLASDVDRLGYGDCKALTNYTRVLLKEVGVESFYTIIYAGNDKSDLNNDFVSVQGNHAILTIPVNNEYVFLECTSQSSPFGFNGNFTDDRHALIVKPNGGEIIKTNDYNTTKSTQIIIGDYTVSEIGDFVANIEIKSKGIQYEDRYRIMSKSSEQKDLFYKENFGWINNLKLNKIDIKNDTENVELIENLSLSANNYVSINNIIIFPLNAFNRSLITPKKYKVRENSFEVLRGFYDIDEIEIYLPNGYALDTKPNNVIIETKFGIYKLEIEIISLNKIKYKRSYLLNEGKYNKNEYEEFRIFNEQINKADNSKVVLKKIMN